MTLFKKRLAILTLSAIVIMAISVTLLDFGDLSWSHNIKSYIGLIVFIILILMKVYLKFNTKRNSQ
jgi:hypothetical protein